MTEVASEFESPFNPSAFIVAPEPEVKGNLCVCGEDLGEPYNPQQGWQDWEQCPNCDLHVHHASWINDMVAKNDELTIRVAHLEATLGLEEAWNEEQEEYTFFADFLVAENQRLREWIFAVADYLEGSPAASATVWCEEAYKIALKDGE